MATYSGTVYNVLGNAIGYTFSADVTYTQSIENNTTTLTITPKVSTGNDLGYAVSMYFKVDGVDYHNAYHNFGTWGNTYTASSYTKVINHNADGTKTFTLNVSFETTYTQGANANLNKGTPKSGTISQSITLPTIPRASSFSFSDFVMGTAGTITINRASSSLTHTLKYAFGSKSGTIGTGLGASTSWTPSRDLGNQIPSSTSGVGTLILETYSGSTHIGTSTKTFTLWIAGDMYPTFTSLTLSGNNLHSGSYIQSVSSVTAKIVGATGSYGSTITSYSISGHGLNTSSSSGTSSVITNAGTVTYTAKITDSRGRSATKTASISVIRYQKPTISITNMYRCNANGNAQNEGTYIRVVAEYSTTSLSNLSRKYTIKYKKTTESSGWTTVVSNASLSNASGTVGYTIPNMSITNSYDISITIMDNYYSSTSTNRAGAASCLMNIEKNGVGIGKFHTKGALDVGGDIYVDGSKFYETGTFNPSFYCSDGCSMSFTRREGTYEKIGKWCMCNISLIVEYFNPGNTPSYQFEVINLPFTNKGIYSAVTIGYCLGINITHDVKAYIRPNGSSVAFVYRNGYNIGTITGNHVSANLDIQLSFMYQVEE
jgi:hypothetical protein